MLGGEAPSRPRHYCNYEIVGPALLSDDAVQVDAYGFNHALLADEAQRGVRIFDRTTIVDIDATPRGVALVTADKCTVRARWLVFATGYETRDFLDAEIAHLASTSAVA